MLRLGDWNELKITRFTDHGAYLDGGAVGELLMPKAYVTPGLCPGDTVRVFVYLDQQERLVGTTETPLAKVGDFAYLRVAWVNQYGAFLDWGLVKELFLPFKEQKGKLRPGMQVPVLLYIDKSNRLCATMHIYRHLQSHAPYEKNDRVTGMVYEVKPELGVFIAVDRRYYGMIPAQEVYETYRPGDEVTVRVLKIRNDGKLDLSARRKAHAQMNEDAEKVWKAILEYDGELPFTDKTDPAIIKRELSLSKNAFKRAVGHLLKQGRIELWDQSIVRKK